MNNRFKFRAWDKINEEWLNIPHLSLDVESGLLNGFFDYEEAAKRRYVLEQCTGLKDNNGKLIYEGDIVEVSEAYENGIYKIEFCQSDCEYNLYNTEGNFIYQLTKSMARYMEVIGNIHENADLLEVGAK